MKPSSISLFAMLLSVSLLTGCASTGATPASSDAETSAPAAKASSSEQTPAPENKPAKSSGGKEPECD